MIVVLIQMLIALIMAITSIRSSVLAENWLIF